MSRMKVLVTVRNQQGQCLDARILEVGEVVRVFDVPADLLRGDVRCELVGVVGGRVGELVGLQEAQNRAMAEVLGGATSVGGEIRVRDRRSTGFDPVEGGDG